MNEPKTVIIGTASQKADRALHECSVLSEATQLALNQSSFATKEFARIEKKLLARITEIESKLNQTEMVLNARISKVALRGEEE